MLLLRRRSQKAISHAAGPPELVQTHDNHMHLKSELDGTNPRTDFDASKQVLVTHHQRAELEANPAEVTKSRAQLV
jgi:hypothetical protein